MGVFGNDVPIIKLIAADGTIHNTLTLPHPSKGGRLFNYKMEGDPKINPLTGDLLPRSFGVRPVLKLRYDLDQDTAEDLITVFNSPLQIQIQPYNNAIIFLAVITDFQYSHYEGDVEYDTLEIEFTGIKRIGKIPNLDTLYTFTKNKLIS